MRLVKMKLSWQSMRIILPVACLLLVLLAARLLLGRRAIGDYSDPGGPRFEGSYAGEVGEFDGSLRVVTWNLHHAEKLEQAIQTLEDGVELRDADILLLQEVDLAGVETIAQRLQYNYVYYPAFFSRRFQKEFGNAILARWPLSNPDKIVLPNALPGWLESRNSARATILLAGRGINIYSVHLDYTWMLLRRGESQVEFLSRAASGKDNFIILGGDFNTWTPASLAFLGDWMGNIGLHSLTRGTGYTFERFGREFTLDHIFSKGVLDYQAGVYRQTNASDHYPVWAEMLIGIPK